LSEKPVLAILAGSRKAEIRQNLPVMLSVAEAFPEYQTIIAGAPGLTVDDYNKVLARTPALKQNHINQTITPVSKVNILFGQTYQLLSHASCALVTSGTATLETALFRVPQVVCYYVIFSKISSFIFNHFFHIPYISLVNLIAGYEVVQELFGAKFSRQSVYHELSRLLQDETYRNKMLEGYDKVITTVGKPGASQRAAQLIVRSLS